MPLIASVVACRRHWGRRRCRMNNTHLKKEWNTCDRIGYCAQEYTFEFEQSGRESESWELTTPRLNAEKCGLRQLTREQISWSNLECCGLRWEESQDEEEEEEKTDGLCLRVWKQLLLPSQSLLFSAGSPSLIPWRTHVENLTETITVAVKGHKRKKMSNFSLHSWTLAF